MYQVFVLSIIHKVLSIEYYLLSIIHKVL